MSEDGMTFNGFTRVIINHDGEAVSERRARDMGIIPKVGFMRKDGWSLGAEKELEHVAYRMWPDEWTHKIQYPQTYWERLTNEPTE